MHVAIIQLITDVKVCPPSDGDLYADNRDKFYDGVERHTGDDHDDDVERLIRWLGDAATHGVDRIDGTDYMWLDIDREKAKKLFEPYLHKFAYAMKCLSECSIEDFATGGNGLAHEMRRLNAYYEFDDFYVVGDGTCVQPISDWLRCVIGTQSLPTKWYVGATYDGDQ